MASPVYQYYMREVTKETVSRDIQDIKSKITAQTKYLEVINKSQLTHRGIQTKLFVTSFDSYKHIDNFLYNITNVLKHKNLSNISDAIIIAAETLIKYKTLTVKFAIYILVNIDCSLIDNINVLNMCASKTKTILQPGVGIDIHSINAYNMPQNIVHLLYVLAELNRLRTKPNSKYVCEYYKIYCKEDITNGCFSFTTLNKKRKTCAKHCIATIKDIINQPSIEQQKIHTLK